VVITDNLQKLREGEPILPEMSEQHAAVTQPTQSGGR